MGPTQLLQLKAILGEAASLIDHLDTEHLHEAHQDRPKVLETLAKLQAASDLLDEEVLAH